MAQAVTTAITDCAAGRLATEAALVVTSYLRNDRKLNAEALDVLHDRLAAIETAASYEHAVSPLGVFYQAVLIAADTDEPCDEARRVRRFATSIALAVEPSIDARVSRALRAYYLKPKYEPAAVLRGLLRVA